MEEFIALVARENVRALNPADAFAVNYFKQLNHEAFVFLEKSNEDENRANIQKIHDAIKKARESSAIKESLRVGRLKGKNEVAVGAFASQIENALQAALGESPEASLDNALALILALQDEKGLECSALAATLGVRLTQEVLINRVEMVLDKELKESHNDIAARVEKAIDDRKKQERWKAKFNLDPTLLDLVYVNVQSGNKFELKSSAQPTDEPLSTKPGTILLSVGAKYKDFTANVVRTLLFNASKDKRQAYQFTLEVLDFAIEQLVVGRQFNEIYEAVRKFVYDKDPILAPYFTRSIGHVLGIEFREPTLALNGKSAGGFVTPGMVFNISVGFGNVQSKDDSNGVYSIWLADTVEIIVGGKPKILTAELDKRMKSINYEITDEEHEKGSAAKPPPVKPVVRPTSSENKPDRKPTVSARSDAPDRRAEQKPSESVVLRDRLRSRAKTATSEDSEKVIEKQKSLRIRKVEEIKKRFSDGKGLTKAINKRSIRKMTSLAAYRDALEFPKDLKPNRVRNDNKIKSLQIHLDVAREAILVPIPGFGHVPFHVSTIRNIFCQAEDKKVYTIRLQFQVPGTVGFGYKSETNPFPDVTGPDGMFIKELIFKSTNPNLPQLCKSLKELQKRIKQREESGDTSMDLAAKIPLDLNKKGGRRVLLKSVMAKTGTMNRRVAGTLEAHLNGLRFGGSRSENIDIIYSNIKHALFQPCENELLVLIHLNLKHPILVNKKKTTDLQFYTEVGAQTDDLDQRRGRSSYDPDEIGEEQRERELRRRLNLEFKKFVESVEEMVRSNGDRLEFELPYRELGFYGVPKNSSQLILPTAHCLVQLTEWPVFVLALDEIELVSFERVYHGLRQFDITFVFKDYSKSVRQITTVPTKSLDMIKRWLNEIDMVWYESKGNLNWAEIFKTIREDITGFAEDGSFEIFLGEDTTASGRPSNQNGSDDSGSDEDDEEYRDANSSTDEVASTDDDDDEDDNSDDDDDESLVDEGESSEHPASSNNGSDEEEGLSWDELEKRAINDDRKRGRHKDDEDEEDEKRMKKRKNR